MPKTGVGPSYLLTIGEEHQSETFFVESTYILIISIKK